MKVLITGKQGQLASSLIERSSGRSALKLVSVGRPAVDLEVPGQVANAIRASRPDVVINAAAYTAVDRAEDEPERAFRINAGAAEEAAIAARELRAPIIQISTDYVFDGSSGNPYWEDSPTNPLGAYGASKLAGEEAVRRANASHLILRLAWVYSPFGNNFVKTMLRLARQREEIAVVSDQRGNPTNALDVADAILTVLEHWSRGNRRTGGATYHLVGQGTCSWAEFATEIIRLGREAGAPSGVVRPVSSAEYPTRARRPMNSSLDSRHFEKTFNFAMPAWRDSLPSVVHRIVAAN